MQTKSEWQQLSGFQGWCYSHDVVCMFTVSSVIFVEVSKKQKKNVLSLLKCHTDEAGSMFLQNHWKTH
jgi:hypothetical protein